LADSFSEELVVRPLRGGKVSYEFSFVTRWDLLSNYSTAHSSRGDHVVLFPKQLAQMITEFELQELHLTFTRGRWFEDDWGTPPVRSPGGAEVYAWFGIAGSKRMLCKLLLMCGGEGRGGRGPPREIIS
jgi:phosphatidylinositol glycan class T